MSSLEDGKKPKVSFMKPWSQQSAFEKKASINYVVALVGGLLLVLAWFSVGVMLVVPFLAMACFAFAYREQIGSLGLKRELKEREEYARLKKKYEPVAYDPMWLRKR